MPLDDLFGAAGQIEEIRLHAAEPGAQAGGREALGHATAGRQRIAGAILPAPQIVFVVNVDVHPAELVGGDRARNTLFANGEHFLAETDEIKRFGQIDALWRRHFGDEARWGCLEQRPLLPCCYTCWRTNASVSDLLLGGKRSKAERRRFAASSRDFTHNRGGVSMAVQQAAQGQPWGQTFWANFLGNAPVWYKQTIIVFLIVNPFLYFLLGGFISGWLLVGSSFSPSPWHCVAIRCNPAACWRSSCGHLGDIARTRLCRSRAQPASDPVAGVHGGRHLLHEGPAALHLYQDTAWRSQQEAVGRVVQPDGCRPLGLPRRAHRNGGDHRRGGGLLSNLQKSALGRGARQARRCRRSGRRRRAGAGGRRHGSLLRFLEKSRHACRGRDGLGRRDHHRRRASERAHRRARGLGVHGFFLQHGAGDLAGC